MHKNLILFGMQNENNLEDQSFKTPKRKNLDAASEMRDHTVIVQVDDMTQVCL